MVRDADIVVVGAGIAGVATARALAQRGRRVLVLEQFVLDHTRGSSHGSSRIFRLSYPDAHYVRLALAAREGWRELEADCGERLIVPSGALDLGAIAIENAKALRSCGVAHELIDGGQVADRWGLRASRDEPALYQPDGGVALADRARAAFVSSARAAGAEIVEHVRVVSLAAARRTVRVTTDRGELTAAAVVVTAGAWAPGLLAPLGIELAVIPTRETVAYFAVPGAETLPSLIDAAIPTGGRHGIARRGVVSYAVSAPGVGLKAGLHHAGPPADPDEIGTADEAVVRWAGEWVESRYRAGVELVAEPETCLYTSTADESFVLERHGRVVVGSACSGHGFKFAPVVGRTLAALACDAAA